MHSYKTVKQVVGKVFPKKATSYVTNYLLKKFVYLYKKSINPNWEHSVNTLLKKRPLSLGVEITTYCNANCSFCAYQHLERKKSNMETELFKKAIDDYVAIGGGNLEITPIVGENFINPNFLDFVNYAASFKEIKKIQFYSNAISMDKCNFEEIINSGVNDIYLSLTGLNEQMYERLYRNPFYNKVYNNIENLLKVNKEKNYPVNVTLCIRGDKPISIMEKFPDYLKLSKIYKFNTNYTNYYSDWAGAIDQGNISGIMEILPPVKKFGICSLMMFYPKILVDGSVTLCGCRDFNGSSDLVVGNINDKSLDEIWSNGKVNSIIENFNNKKYPTICVDCNIYSSGKSAIFEEGRKKQIRECLNSFNNSKVGKNMIAN